MFRGQYHQIFHFDPLVGFVSICGYFGVHLSLIVGQHHKISLLHKEGHIEGGSVSISIKPFLLVGNCRKIGVVGTCNL